MQDSLFVGIGDYGSPCQALDVHNAVLVKRDPLQVRIGMAERVRELAQREFFLPGQDVADPRCILSPSV